MKHIDKLKHFSVFLGGFLVASACLEKAFGLTGVPSFILVSFGISVLAFVTEDLQRGQPGRVKDGWDAYADMLSIPFGMLIYHFGFPLVF